MSCGKVFCTILFGSVAILGAPTLFIVASVLSAQYAANVYERTVSVYNDAVSDWEQSGSAAFAHLPRGFTIESVPSATHNVTRVLGASNPGSFVAHFTDDYVGPAPYPDALNVKYVFDNAGSPAMLPPVSFSSSTVYAKVTLRGPGGPDPITAPSVFYSTYSAVCDGSDDDGSGHCECPVGRKSGTSCYVRARLVGLCLNLDRSTWLPALGRQSGAGCAPIPVLPDGYPLRIPAGTGCLPGSYAGLSPFVYTVEADSLATVVVSFANLTVELRSSADPYSIGLALTQATMDLGTSPDGPFRGAISAWVAFSGSGAMLIALLLCIYTRWCDVIVAKRQGIVATVTSRSRMLRQREQLMQHPLLRDISVVEGFEVPPPMPPTSFLPAPPPNQRPLLDAEGSATELELGEVAAAGTGRSAIPIRDQEWIRILERAPPPPGVPLSVWEGIGPGDREVMLADDLRRAQGWGALGWAGREGSGGRGRCVCRVPLCFAFLTSSVLSWVEFQQSTFRGCCPRLPGMDRAQMIILGSLTTLGSTVISMVLLALFLGTDSGSTIPAASNSGLWICAYSAVCGSGLSRVACSSFQQAALMSLVPEMPPLRGLMLAACILPLCSLVLLVVSVPWLKDRVRRGVLLAGALLFTSGVLSHWAAHAYMYLADVADAASVAYCNLPMNTNAVQCNIMDEHTDLFAASTGMSVVAVALLWLTVGILLGKT